jgi:cytochrome b561
MTPQAYDRRTIAYHWLTAVIVAGLWVAGQSIDLFPRGMPRTTVRSAHVAIGILLGLLLVARIAWRVRRGIRLPPAIEGTAGQLASAAHKLLYLLVVCTVLAGLAAVWVRGLNLFGLVTIAGAYPNDRVLQRTMVGVHEVLANSVLAFAFAHAAMALWHHRVRRDGVLRRMWPSVR